jgi:hypothetical protein
MKVMLDSNSLQARAHAQSGQRLASCLALLNALPAETAFSPRGPLTAEVLAGQDVLVIATRKWQDLPYSDAELDCIVAFVQRGGGLLLMSNHGDVPGRYPNDMTQNDARLAQRWDVTVENTFFASPTPNVVVEFSGPDLAASHPIVRGAPNGSPVRSVVTNNCCSLRLLAGAPLIRLNRQLVDQRNGWSVDDRFFAVAVAEGVTQRGRVVIVADSGFIGTAETTFPGIGLIEHGDNGRFAQNCVAWLGRAL